MLFSIQQRYILTLLRGLKCLRSEQLRLLLARSFPRPGGELPLGAVEAMLRQLRYCCGDVIFEGGIVRMRSAEPDMRMLEAIDVMLELTDGRAQNISAGREPPVLLRFALSGERPRLFAVAEAGDPIPAELDAGQRETAERIVWISPSSCTEKPAALPPGHFFAERLPDGSHRFYGSKNS